MARTSASEFDRTREGRACDGGLADAADSQNQRRSDHVLDPLDELARERIELSRAQCEGITVDPALGAAKRHVDDRGLPRHERGERRGFVLVHGRVVAQAALERPPSAIVLNSIAEEMK